MLNQTRDDKLSADLLTSLKEQLGGLIVENWFKGLEISQDGPNISLFFQNQFIKDWVNTHYIDNIHKALKVLTGQEHVYLCFDLKNNKNNIEQINKSGEIEQHTFENFIIGKTNEMAYTAAVKVSQNIRGNLFNPLFIYGEPGVGKSHLLSAIVNHVRVNNADIKIYYMTAEEFMYTFIKALKENGIVGFKQELREANLFLVDDVQFMMGKDSTQEEFFHTFNFLKNNRCQIVLSSDKSPNQLDQLAGRLRSRLGGGLTIEIHQPDYELRLSILLKLSKTSDSQGIYQPKTDVLEFLAQNIHGNVRDLEGAWTKLATYAKWMNQSVSLQLAQEVLKEQLTPKIKKTLDKNTIQVSVCEMYKITLDDMLSDKRDKHIVRARHIAMFLIKRELGYSASDIGRIFNGKDHTSVLYAIEKIARELEKDELLQGELEYIKNNYK